MEKIPVYALAGFLGSGKTTVLKNILENMEGIKTGVIQNEFGKVGIDGKRLKSEKGIEMIELNRGSIFCACLRLSFVQALADMAEKDIECIFVESSGIGDPSNIEEIVAAANVLAKDKLELKGVLCLCDGVNFEKDLEAKELETVMRQVKHCNVAVISKRDLIDEKREEEIRKRIREINPLCPIYTSVKGVFPLDFLKDDLSKYRWAKNEDSTNSEETKPKTITLFCKESIDKNQLENFLKELAPYVYRVKGDLVLSGKMTCIDMVGEKIDFKESEETEPSLVLIAKIGNKIVRKALEIWTKNVDVKMEMKNG